MPRIFHPVIWFRIFMSRIFYLCNFYGVAFSCSAFSLAPVCLQATSLGEAQRGQHITPCKIMLQFVSLYNLLCVDILWSQVTAPTAVSLSHRLTAVTCSHFTLGNPKSDYQQYSYMLQVIYVMLHSASLPDFACGGHRTVELTYLCQLVDGKSL